MLSKSNFNLANSYLRGFFSDRKIVVFESDDWGSIRMPSQTVFAHLQKKGLDVISNPFNRIDSIETDFDIISLLDILNKIKIQTGKTVKLTLNFVLANPDFDLIKKFNFEVYFYEDFITTYKNHKLSENVYSLIKEGIELGYFKPQFHAREHINIDKWLQLLRNNNSKVIEAFNYRTFAFTLENYDNLWETYSYVGNFKDSSIESSINEGLFNFEKYFGFKSSTTIAPVAVWDDNVERVFAENGIFVYQGFLIQKLKNEFGYSQRFNYTGKKLENGTMYLVRNCYFEPSTSNIDWVDKCFKQVKTAFLFRKPAIISMHRLNFSSRINESNNKINIELFYKLISRIIKQWPNVEFVFSDDLSNLINSKL